MADETDNLDGAPLSEGARLRAEADAEINPSNGSDPRIGFERALREGVARVMGEPSKAPESLSAEVERICRLTPDALDALEASDDSGVVLSPAGDTRSRGFWASTPRIFAVAAVLAVGATLAIVAWPTNRGGPSFPSGPMGRAASFVSDEHARCGDFGRVFERKMPARTPAEAIREAVEVLEEIPEVMDLPIDGLVGLGYEFAGLGECAVPGKGRSVHLLYKSSDSNAAPLSLFVQQDTGQLALDPVSCYVADATPACEVAQAEIAEAKLNAPEIVIWKRDGLVFYLYVPALSEPAEPIRRALDVPEDERLFIEA